MNPRPKLGKGATDTRTVRCLAMVIEDTQVRLQREDLINLKNEGYTHSKVVSQASKENREVEDTDSKWIS